MLAKSYKHHSSDMMCFKIRLCTKQNSYDYCSNMSRNDVFLFSRRPTALAYILLCTLPCFAILIASSKVQVDNGQWRDAFTELPVSLVLVCLICVDVIERIRPCKLTGRSDSLDPDLDMPGPVLTHLEQVTTVSSQTHTDDVPNGVAQVNPEVRNGSAQGRWQDPPRPPSSLTTSSRATSATYLYSSSSRTRAHSGTLGFLWRRDARAEVLVDTFLFWMDTVEMVRVAGVPAVFYSAWVFPVYILALMSTLRMVITPQNPLLSLAGVALQDFPFFILRVALIVVFGYVTPVLYPLKNVLVSLTFIYFTFLTRLKVFKRQSMF
ncbi:transmembrane protein 236 [Xyrichtys novacula]|uniref:Transmembrane protein 236 n=1 Tax=Xyrichtys novacula TaxID=13765 RepID=A0AAV1GGK3_XYRNO|nr:transmembrane protein 236 [Xyrichtys novacula]